MLLSFKLSNYRSFLDEQSFSLKIGDGPNEVLNLAVIFGKNAAGKSNLLKAMADAKRLVTKPEQRLWPPFFSKVSKNNKISKFEFEFSIKGGDTYRYSLSVFTGIECEPYNYSIVEEELYDLSTKKPVFSDKNGLPKNPVKIDFENLSNLNNRLNELRIQYEFFIRKKKELEYSKNVLNAKIGPLINDDAPGNDNKDNIQMITAEIKSIEEQIEDVNDKINLISSLSESTKEELRKIKIDTDYQNSRNITIKSRLYRVTKEADEKGIDKDLLPHYEKVYRWFSDTLTIISPEEHLFRPNDNGFIEKVSKIIQNFDVGIKELSYKKMDEEETKWVKQLIIDREKDRINYCSRGSLDDIFTSFIAKDKSGLYRLSFWRGKMTMDKIVTRHSDDSESVFDLNEESDGTARLVEIASVLLKEEDERIFIIDEMDRCMHPLLTRHIIEDYLAMQDDNKQLIFTSHEHTLLNNLFYPEEFWTVECVNNRSSLKHDVKTMRKCSMRKDKAFTAGKLGGTPDFD